MSRPCSAVAFDLGNTLVEYYRPDEFPAVLRESVGAVHRFLAGAGVAVPPIESVRARAMEHNQDPPDHRVRPLPGRLVSLFGIPPERREDGLLERASLAFLGPIWARARVYEDTVPVLRRLRSLGYRTGIVSNLPWGSQPALWRREVERLGVLQEVDVPVFCGDAGYRKPAPEVFRFVLDRLGVPAGECAFVGDHPVWDHEGARRAGMRPVLIDREDHLPGFAGERVRDLGGLLARLGIR